MAAEPAFDSPDLLRLRDPLSEVTRKERRALLGVSLLGVALVKAGLLPTEISALGVKLAAADQRMLALLLAVVCLYFLIAFLAYAASDFLAWQVSLHAAISKRVRESVEASSDEYEDMIHNEVWRVLQERYPWTQRANRYVLPVSWARGLLEFGVPVIFALYAVCILAKSAA
jgi:hypothetical protein